MFSRANRGAYQVESWAKFCRKEIRLLGVKYAFLSLRTIVDTYHLRWKWVRNLPIFNYETLLSRSEARARLAILINRSENPCYRRWSKSWSNAIFPTNFRLIFRLHLMKKKKSWNYASEYLPRRVYYPADDTLVVSEGVGRSNHYLHVRQRKVLE